MKTCCKYPCKEVRFKGRLCHKHYVCFTEKRSRYKTQHRRFIKHLKVKNIPCSIFKIDIP